MKIVIGTSHVTNSCISHAKEIYAHMTGKLHTDIMILEGIGAAARHARSSIFVGKVVNLNNWIVEFE
jgi:hypothetical protein